MSRVAASGPNGTPPFIQKTIEMLSSSELKDYISWNSAGDAIIVRNVRSLVSALPPFRCCTAKQSYLLFPMWSFCIAFCVSVAGATPISMLCGSLLTLPMQAPEFALRVLPCVRGDRNPLMRCVDHTMCIDFQSAGGLL